MTSRTNWKAKYTALVAEQKALSATFVELRTQHNALNAQYHKLVALQAPPHVPVSLLTLDAKRAHERALMRAAREEAVRTGRCVKVTA